MQWFLVTAGPALGRSCMTRSVLWCPSLLSQWYHDMAKGTRSPCPSWACPGETMCDQICAVISFFASPVISWHGQGDKVSFLSGCKNKTLTLIGMTLLETGIGRPWPAARSEDSGLYLGTWGQHEIEGPGTTRNKSFPRLPQVAWLLVMGGTVQMTQTELHPKALIHPPLSVVLRSPTSQPERLAIHLDCTVRSSNCQCLLFSSDTSVLHLHGISGELSSVSSGLLYSLGFPVAWGWGCHWNERWRLTLSFSLHPIKAMWAILS